MTTKKAHTVPRVFSISLLVVLLAMPVWPFLSTWLGSFGGLLVFKSLPTILLAVLMAAGLLYLLINHRDILKTLLKSRLVQIISVFAVLVLISVALTASGEQSRVAAVAMDLRYWLSFIVALAIVQLDRSFWQKVIEKLSPVAIAVGVGLSILGLAQVLVLPPDFLTYFGYGPDTIAPSMAIDQTGVLRAFATLRGPNDFAAFLIIPLLLAMAQLFKKRDVWTVSAPIIIGIGIFVSSSRSAMVAAALALGVMLAVKLPKAIYKTKRFWAGALAVLIVASAGLILALNNPYLRLHILHIRDNHDSSLATSNSDHVDYAQDSVERIIDQPLGCGAGCSGPASYYGDSAKISENYYLQITEEYGVLGIALWGSAIVLLIIQLWKHRKTEIYLIWVSALFGYLFIGLLLHVFIDEPLAITWFTLAGILVGLAALKKTHQSGRIDT